MDEDTVEPTRGSMAPTDKSWMKRNSVRTIRRMASPPPGQRRRKSDDSDNQRSRLDAEESVHLGGVVLTEYFTPSTASGLIDATRHFQRSNSGSSAGHFGNRTAAGAGAWQEGALIRRPGASTVGLHRSDPSLPPAVDAVWTRIYWLTPSLTAIVATFTIVEEFGDVSDLLRADYSSSHGPFKLTIDGNFGAIRALIPWSRPRSWRSSTALLDVAAKKRAAVDSRIESIEAECQAWMKEKFRGTLSERPTNQRPLLRLMLTKDYKAFTDDSEKYRAAQLTDTFSEIWQTTDRAAWRIMPIERRGHAPITVAAIRRKDAPGEDGSDPQSAWALTQDFHQEHAGLAVLVGMPHLLDMLSSSVADLRDQFTGTSRFERPVKRALAVDRFLSRNGLDASTVAADLRSRDHWSSLEWFISRLPNYEPDTESRLYQAVGPPDQQRSLARVIDEDLIRRAERLDREVASVIGVVNTSAQLRQAVSNTRLQRVVIALTTLAAVLAIISLVVTLTG